LKLESDLRLTSGWDCYHHCDL